MKSGGRKEKLKSLKGSRSVLLLPRVLEHDNDQRNQVKLPSVSILPTYPGASLVSGSWASLLGGSSCRVWFGLVFSHVF